MASATASAHDNNREWCCPGVVLPGPPGAPAGRVLCLSALMFADDFTGVAESLTALQAGMDAARAWCDRWSMQANVGPRPAG